MSSHTKSERSFVGLSRLRQMPEPRYEDLKAPIEQPPVQANEASSPFSWLKTTTDVAPSKLDEKATQPTQTVIEPKPYASKPKSDMPFSLQSLKQAFIDDTPVKQEAALITPDVSFETTEQAKETTISEPIAVAEPIIEAKPVTKADKKRGASNQKVSTAVAAPEVKVETPETKIESSAVKAEAPKVDESLSHVSLISSQELYVLQHKLYEAMLYLSGLLANEKASIDEIQPRLDALKTMVPLFQQLQGTLK